MSAGDFWSRRKAGVVAEAEAEVIARTHADNERVEAALAERSDEELLADLNLPEPEALDSPEAVRDFLQSALPQRLKTRALRHLWRMNPVFANLDGLVDYGEDFTDSATVIENLQTAYQVGRGMLSHIESLAAESTADDANSEVTEGEHAAPDAEVLNADEGQDLLPQPAEREAAEVAPQADPVDEVPVSTVRRRMRFSFDDTPT